MITFLISLAALVLGYLVYGRFVERIFVPDDRVTPAVAQAMAWTMSRCLIGRCL